MTAKELIDKILSAEKPSDLFPIVTGNPATDIQHQYREYAKMVHPDVCKEEGALEAFQALKDFYYHASVYPKERCKNYYGQKLLIRKALDISAFELGARYVTEKQVIWLLDSGKERFRDNYIAKVGGIIGKLNTAGSNPSKKSLRDMYLPLVPKIDDRFETKDTHRLGIAVEKDPGYFPMDLFLKAYKDQLGGRDIAWMISRMIDLCCMLDLGAYAMVLNGFSEGNLFIDPKRHSISIPGGWWYAVMEGEKMIGTSKDIYRRMDHQTKTTYTATPYTDIECVRGIAERIIQGNPDVPDAMIRWIYAGSLEDPLEEKKRWDEALKKAYGARRFVTFDFKPEDIYTQRRT